MAITEKYVTSAGAGAHDGSSEANAFSWTEMVTDINAGGKAGNRYNVKGNVSGLGASSSISGSGTSTSPIIIRGYTTTPGDGYLGRTNGNGPLITTNMPVVSYNSTFRLNVTGSWFLFESLKFTGAVSNAVVTVNADSALSRCIIENSSTNAAAGGLSLGNGRSRAVNCDAALTGGSGGAYAMSSATGGASTSYIGCRACGGAAPSLLVASTSVIVLDSVWYGGSIGISCTSSGFTGIIAGNTIVDNAGDGIDIITGVTSLIELVNNLITDNGGYGLDANSAATAIVASHNRFDRNTSGATNLATDWLSATSFDNNTTGVLKAAEYQDASTFDYRLLSTSPAKGAGIMVSRDIGAPQRVEPSSSGGGVTLLKSSMIQAV